MSRWPLWLEVAVVLAILALAIASRAADVEVTEVTIGHLWPFLVPLLGGMGAIALAVVGVVWKTTANLRDSIVEFKVDVAKLSGAVEGLREMVSMTERRAERADELIKDSVTEMRKDVDVLLRWRAAETGKTNGT